MPEAPGDDELDLAEEADVLERGESLRQRLDVVRARCREADLGHRLAEQFAILGLVDRLGGSADHFDVVGLQDAHFLQTQGAVERSLATHRRQKRETAGGGVTLLGDNLGDDFGGDRLDVGAVGHIRISHDRSGIRIDEYDPVSLGAQRLAGLRPRIIEFTGLADDDRSSANDQNGRYVGPLRHSILATRTQKKAASRALPPRCVLRMRPWACSRPPYPGPT